MEQVTSRGKTIGRTIAIVIAVAVVNALVFVAQLVLGFGPASESTKVPDGSPAWFAAVERWVMFDEFVLWPLLIVAGAAVQRLWCPASPAVSAVAVIVPALLAHHDPGGQQWMVAAVLYVAAALGTAVLVDMMRARRRPSSPS